MLRLDSAVSSDRGARSALRRMPWQCCSFSAVSPVRLPSGCSLQQAQDSNEIVSLRRCFHGPILQLSCWTVLSDLHVVIWGGPWPLKGNPPCQAWLMLIRASKESRRRLSKLAPHEQAPFLIGGADAPKRGS